MLLWQLERLRRRSCQPYSQDRAPRPSGADVAARSARTGMTSRPLGEGVVILALALS